MPFRSSAGRDTSGERAATKSAWESSANTLKKIVPQGAFSRVCWALREREKAALWRPFHSFNGDDIVINRLAARENGDLGIRTVGAEHISCLLSILFSDILAKIQRDKFRAPAHSLRRQFRQQSFNGGIRTKKFPLLQGQIVPLLDVEAVELRIPGAYVI